MEEPVEWPSRAPSHRPAEEHEVEVAVEHLAGRAVLGGLRVHRLADRLGVRAGLEEGPMCDQAGGVREQVTERDVPTREAGEPCRGGVLETPSTLVDEHERECRGRDDLGKRGKVVARVARGWHDRPRNAGVAAPGAEQHALAVDDREVEGRRETRFERGEQLVEERLASYACTSTLRADRRASGEVEVER